MNASHTWRMLCCGHKVQPDTKGIDGPDWWLTACLDWERDRWLGYVLGYWKAADLIASHVADTGRDQDTLIYAFLMCWRHYIELQLKVLLTLLAQSLRELQPLPRTGLSACGA